MINFVLIHLRCTSSAFNLRYLHVILSRSCVSEAESYSCSVGSRCTHWYVNYGNKNHKHWNCNPSFVIYIYLHFQYTSQMTNLTVLPCVLSTNCRYVSVCIRRSCNHQCIFGTLAATRSSVRPSSSFVVLRAVAGAHNGEIFKIDSIYIIKSIQLSNSKCILNILSGIFVNMH